MADITKLIHELTGLSVTHQLKLFYSLIVIISIYLLRLIVNKYIVKNIKEVKHRYKVTSFSSYFSYITTLLILMKIWIDGFGSLITVFGLISAGLAFALQDFVKSFAGWIFIIWRSPFKVGDRVQIGSIKGDIIDIRVFKIVLLEIGNWVEHEQSTGRVIYLPNSMVINENIFNYFNGLDYIWDELGILVTFESDWEKAKSDFMEIIKKNMDHSALQKNRKGGTHSENHLIHYNTLEPIVYVDVKDSGVNLGIRYLVDPKKRRIMKSKLWEDILKKISESDYMDLAYPTTRIYLQNNPQNL